MVFDIFRANIESNDNFCVKNNESKWKSITIDEIFENIKYPSVTLTKHVSPYFALLGFAQLCLGLLSFD